MNIRDRLQLSFNRLLASSPEGRAHILNQVAEAESGGEAAVFDQLLAKVDDPVLARMIEKHRDDEIRHAEVFRGCLARTGVALGPVPAHLKVLDRIDRNLGGFFDRPIEGARGVMEAYLLLQVIEERAVHQFDLLEKAFRPVDPETADTFLAVSKDEERHLKYCHAISRRYAPDEATRVDTLHRFRLAEAASFRDNSAANLSYILDNRLVGARSATIAWGVIGAFTRTLDSLPFTRFADEATTRGKSTALPLAA